MRKSFLGILIFFTGVCDCYSQTNVSKQGSGKVASPVLRTNGTYLPDKEILENTSPQKKADAGLLNDQNLLHENFHQLTVITALGKFSPPLASRIFSYTSLAAYEALRFEKPRAGSLVNDLKGFSQMPVPDKNKKYNYLLAATKAFFTVALKITSAKDTITGYEDKLYVDFKNLLANDTYENSMELGELVGNAVLERARIDQYEETRAMPKFLESEEPGKWRRTPAGYLAALEPNWGKIVPLALDSAAEIKAPSPPPYSLEKNSAFYNAVNEVYEIGVNLNEERKTIAKYWDDNPLVKELRDAEPGNKKITPVAHWIGIAGIACKVKNLSAVETAKTYAVTSVAMHDAIIACWSQKYIHNVIRPVTVINQFIDSSWHSFLQTPPTPEHSSGHSSISAAAATVLTHLFGDNFVFEDTSDLAYIGMKRKFPSFNSAAQEVSISRMYGGIHYRTGIEAGAAQGRMVGAYVIKKLLKESAKRKG